MSQRLKKIRVIIIMIHKHYIFLLFLPCRLSVIYCSKRTIINTEFPYASCVSNEPKRCRVFKNQSVDRCTERVRKGGGGGEEGVVSRAHTAAALWVSNPITGSETHYQSALFYSDANVKSKDHPEPLKPRYVWGPHQGKGDLVGFTYGLFACEEER